MKKVYLIYLILDADKFNSRLNLLLPVTKSFKYKNGNMFGLYAWTNKKSLLSEFSEIRNLKVFKIYEREIDEEKFDDFSLEFSDYRLSRYSFKENYKDENSDTKEIVTTKNEYVVSTEDNGFVYLSDFAFRFNDLGITPKIFKKNITNALDILGYWNILYSIKGSESTRDYIGNNMSYGLSALGKPVCINEESFTNEYLILLFLFRDLFF